MPRLTLVFGVDNAAAAAVAVEAADPDSGGTCAGPGGSLEARVVVAAPAAAAGAPQCKQALWALVMVFLPPQRPHDSGRQHGFSLTLTLTRALPLPLPLPLPPVSLAAAGDVPLPSPVVTAAALECLLLLALLLLLLLLLLPRLSRAFSARITLDTLPTWFRLVVSTKQSNIVAVRNRVLLIMCTNQKRALN
jgi:hypothetical protein